MEGIIDKEDGRIRRFFALLDNIEKKVERLACDYRDQGRIPYIQLGGKILYRQSDIEKLLEENYHPALV